MLTTAGAGALDRIRIGPGIMAREQDGRAVALRTRRCAGFFNCALTGAPDKVAGHGAVR